MHFIEIDIKQIRQIKRKIKAGIYSRMYKKRSVRWYKVFNKAHERKVKNKRKNPTASMLNRPRKLASIQRDLGFRVFRTRHPDANDEF